MDDETMMKTRRWSKAMAHLCVFSAAVFLAVSIWQWASMDPSDLALWLGVPEVRVDHGRTIMVLLMMALPAFINAYGLMRLRSSFLAFVAGDIFSDKAIAGLRQFGSAGLLAVLGSAILTPLAGYILTYGSATGADFPIRIGTGSLTILVTSAFTWTFARILGIAAGLERRNRELAEENAAIV